MTRPAARLRHAALAVIFCVSTFCGVGIAAQHKAPSVTELTGPPRAGAAADTAIIVRVTTPLPGLPMPTGSIEILSDDEIIGTVALTADDAAAEGSLHLSLPHGAHVLVARYAGDERFIDSLSAPIVVVIGAAR